MTKPKTTPAERTQLDAQRDRVLLQGKEMLVQTDRGSFRLRDASGLEVIVLFLNGGKWLESQNKIIRALRAVQTGREVETPRFKAILLNSSIAFRDGKYVVEESPQLFDAEGWHDPETGEHLSEATSSEQLTDKDPGPQVWWLFCAALRSGDAGQDRRAAGDRSAR